MIKHGGTGPDIVLVHGWAMHSGIFGDFADALAADWTVHHLELPGHGRQPPDQNWSPASLAAQALDQLPGASWLCWSLGGQVAIEAGLMAPGKIERMIMLGVNPCFVAREDWPCGMDRPVFDEFERRCMVAPKDTVEKFLMLQMHGSERANAVTRELARRHAQSPFPDIDSLLRGLHWLGHSDYRRQLAQLVVSTLWIAGERDPLVPVASATEAAAMMPSARTVTVAGAGHAPFISHSEQLLECINDFCSERSPA